ncbi:hypothetical protein KM043_003941 [Ampulex compressa]|nr:hypothetical protein KM043_003941 [Ampulex compressa]
MPWESRPRSNRNKPVSGAPPDPYGSHETYPRRQSNKVPASPPTGTCTLQPCNGVEILARPFLASNAASASSTGRGARFSPGAAAFIPSIISSQSESRRKSPVKSWHEADLPDAHVLCRLMPLKSESREGFVPLVVVGGPLTGSFARISSNDSGSEHRNEDDREKAVFARSTKPNQFLLLVSVSQYDGDQLNLTRITRSEMGAYLCIAKNGVPPTVSKRITVDVEFSPMIFVPNQLVGAPAGTNVTIDCQTEAYPRAMNYWYLGEEMILSNDKYTASIMENSYRAHMRLTIRNLQAGDFGNYRCISKNSLGETEGSIRLYEIPKPSAAPKATEIKSSANKEAKCLLAFLSVPYLRRKREAAGARRAQSGTV